MTKIFIGVYGASDKTEIKIEFESGEIIGQIEVEEANIFLSIKHSWDAIIRGVNLILKSSGLDLQSVGYSFHMGLGLKYTELLENCIAFEKARPQEINQLILKSDGYALCLGSHKNKIGGAIIADQGMVGTLLIDEKFYKIGGWGFPHADKGSYPWLGMQAIRLTLGYVDGYIKESPLLLAILDFFNNSTSDIVKWSMNDGRRTDEYFIIANIVLNHFISKDPHAVALLKKVAEEVEQIYSQLEKKSSHPSFPFCFFGYLVSYVRPLLSERIQKNITDAQGNGVNGSLRLIKIANEK
jgi:glucosamine kinase